MSRRRYLYACVFIAGFSALGAELAASRLLDPWFGNSLIVWASLIGLILAYLSVGYLLGGWLADRWPRPSLLYHLLGLAGAGLGLVPMISRPVLRLASGGFSEWSFNVALLAGSLLAVLILFAGPMILIGCVAPFAIRLALSDLSFGGRTAGRIYSLSTVGSIAGTFLTPLVLIPWLGTRWTFAVLGGSLLLAAIVGLLFSGRSLDVAAYGVLGALLAFLLWWGGRGPIKPEAGLLYEAESPYNYIQVVRQGTEVQLRLNEGQGLHSVYDPAGGLSYGIWDYFLLAPLFRAAEPDPEAVGRVCLIGLAGGTVARLYTEAFGPVPIDGVEIDPAVIDVGRRYFAMNEPNLTSIAQDGRIFLRHTAQRYDVIAVDAYRPPYIPFHLTTVEFFQLARSRLTPNGVVAVNVGRTHDDFRLVDAIASTAAQVFPSVYVIDEPDPGYGLGNSLVVATARATTLLDFQRNSVEATNPLVQQVLEQAGKQVRAWAPVPGTPVFTDDRAPVEQVVHSIILRYLFEEPDLSHDQ